MKCSVGHCKQQACLASGDDQVCGDHWKETIEYRRIEDEKTQLLRLIDKVSDGDSIRRVLRILAERSFN